MASTYSNSNKNRRGKVKSPENFLEALRSLGKGAVSEVKNQAKSALVTDIPESLGFNTSGQLKPNESLSLQDIQAAEERGRQDAESQFSARLQQVRQAERSRLMQEEASAKQQITAIREEIMKLAKSMGDFAQEVQVATMQAPVNPGIYHKNFYSHLKSVISTLRTKVESSKNWLAAANSRSKKQGFYWSQVGKSGTKYMLSSERYMVTSTG